MYLIAEAGATHDGYEDAVKLLNIANKSGFNAFKIQMIDADRIMSDKTQLFEYGILSGETIKDSLYDVLKKDELTKDEIRNIKTYCDGRGLDFISTAMYEDDVDFLVDIGCKTIKVCSGDIDLYDLISYISKKDVCIHLDSGNATIAEVEKAVDCIEENNRNIVIHHCPSGYPAKVDKVNLNIIKTLKQMFPYPIAFSDHSPSWDMCMIAIGLGATVLEKTITLDRNKRADEHMFSLDIHGARKFVETVRMAITALGSNRKHISEEERINNLKVRRQLRNGTWSRPRDNN